jgi:predicted lipoprotein with Yx(FWY)xxD motif
MNLKSRLILIATLVLVIAACGGDDEPGAGDTTVPAEDTTVPAGDTTTTAGDTTTTGGDDAEAMDGVHATETDLGTILVDADGFTLYVFTVDTDGESACYDDCADLWPPAPGDSAISSDLDASIFGTTTRTDGSEQLTVSGAPLYRYTPDANPGDTAGQGVAGVWFVVDSAGEMIGGPEANADTSTTTDDGLDY